MSAVGLERVSTITGYQIKKGNFSTTSPNLPQRIAILGEANTANQGALSLDPKEIVSAQAAGLEYGFGSPIHSMVRILKPISGSGVGGIPIVVYPQAEAVAAAAKEIDLTPTGVANGNGTHTVVISGRNSIDGQSYDVGILSGDDEDAIAQRISDVVNAVLGTPVIGVPTLGVGAKATLTAKWNGLSSNDINVSIDVNGDDLGITYAIADVAAGAGTPAVTLALDKYDAEWNTITLNSYGTVSSVMDELEVFNGVPDNTAPTGRYTGIVMKPFVALTGSVESDVDSLIAITDPRKSQVTISICPAPNSDGMPYEAAANAATLWARQAQDNPHLDIQNKVYPDMPTPTDIGDMKDYDQRDRAVKGGCSTVELSAGQYKVKDFVTTYHPDGELPPQFRYCRTFVIDMNFFFGYHLLEEVVVMDKSISADDDIVTVVNTIKPKQWKQSVSTYFEDTARRGLIVDPAFSQARLSVGLSVSNPDRFETEFPYKRSGFARIAATAATAGFNFGV
tara:strand:+ start:1749 stop:3272 length:1524 start_codon:yes stop_codon:yes gene_type:complete